MAALRDGISEVKRIRARYFILARRCKDDKALLALKTDTLRELQAVFNRVVHRTAN